MLYVQLYLLVGLIITLWGIQSMRSKHHQIQEPWAAGCTVLIVGWPVIAGHDLIEWIVEQVKWRWG